MRVAFRDWWPTMGSWLSAYGQVSERCFDELLARRCEAAMRRKSSANRVFETLDPAYGFRGLALLYLYATCTLIRDWAWKRMSDDLTRIIGGPNDA